MLKKHALYVLLSKYTTYSATVTLGSNKHNPYFLNFSALDLPPHFRHTTMTYISRFKG